MSSALRKAAQQALEEIIDKYIGRERDHDRLDAIRAALAEPVEPVQWTDADADAARLALELEALLLDTKDLAVVSRWWDSGHDALELHRQRLRSERAHGIGDNT
jgi:hypothetical protein